MDVMEGKRVRGNGKLKAAGIVGRIALGVLFTEIAVVAVLFIVIGVMRMGENRLRSVAGAEAPVLDLETAEVSPSEHWQEGWVRYEGKIYEYNDDILTFLVLGIDKMEKVSPNVDKVSGGQSDAIFLAVMDTGEKRVSLIGVNRDTMVDVRMVGIGENGEDLIAPAQLAVQHGFGDGMAGSCELTREAVSELFFGLPIHGYVSFNMGGVAALNDAVGGVEVTVLEDLTKLNKDWTEGKEIRLEGTDAFWYVKWRDITIYESARNRLARQKQYLSAFSQQAIAVTREDIRTPVTLYGELKDYIITDITIDEMAYLARELIHYDIDSDTIYSLEGITERGEEFEEFYPDKDALRDLMVRVFYREVEQQAE